MPLSLIKPLEDAGGIPAFHFDPITVGESNEATFCGFDGMEGTESGLADAWCNTQFWVTDPL